MTALAPRLADRTLLSDRCYVDGAFVGEPADAVTNPANGEVIVSVPRFGEAETVAGLRGGQWHDVATWFNAVCAACIGLAH